MIYDQNASSLYRQDFTEPGFGAPWSETMGAEGALPPTPDEGIRHGNAYGRHLRRRRKENLLWNFIGIFGKLLGEKHYGAPAIGSY